MLSFTHVINGPLEFTWSYGKFQVRVFILLLYLNGLLLFNSSRVQITVAFHEKKPYNHCKVRAEFN